MRTATLAEIVARRAAREDCLGYGQGVKIKARIWLLRYWDAGAA